MIHLFKTLAMVAIMSMVALLTASAYDFELDGLQYTILSEADKTCKVTGYDESISGDITIPQQVNGYSVTAIGDNAFYYCHDIRNIAFPDNITSIGNYAFFGSDLEGEVVFPKCLETIGESAFSGCKFTKVSLQENFAIIVRGAFSSCWGLREIAVSANNPNFASYDGVLYNKDFSVLICCPGGKGSFDFPDNVSQIGDYSFVGDSLKELVIPQGVTSIGQYAFWNCRQLTRVVIPESVTSIGEQAFRECGLTEITIPNGVAAIEESTFTSCQRLVDVSIPRSVKRIARSAFSDCSSLADVIIPQGVTFIGPGAFRYCHKLSSISIPETVTGIGDAVFNSCDNLKRIVSFAVVPPSFNSIYFGYSPFEDYHYSSAKLLVPKGCTSAYKAADYWKEFLDIEEFDPTGVEPVAAADGQLAVKVDGNSLIVEGAEGPVNVFGAGGALVARVGVIGGRARIALPGHGLYVVKAGGAVRKVSM